MALIQSARWVEAREAGRELCRAYGNDAEAWFLLGAIHGQMSEWAEAEACSEKAAMLSPNTSAAHFNLGVAKLRQRKPGAAASLRRTVSLQPDHPAAHDLLKEACFMEGLLLTEAENLEEARKFLASALRDADSFQIRMLLGEICMKLSRRDAAIVHYRRATELDPRSATARSGLADAILLGDPSHPVRLKALEHLRIAVELDPGSVAARNNLAAALTMLGYHEEAVKEYEKALDLSPGFPASIWGIVRAYEAAGQAAKAETILRPWLDRATTTLEIALAYGIVAPHLGERKAAIESLRHALTQEKCDQETEKTACFLLGDLLDKEGEYDEAFESYHRGNSLSPLAYNHAGYVQRFSTLIDNFSSSRMAKFPRATNRSNLPIFIVGMPRSGTTLIESILASHPQVHGAGELDDILLIRQDIDRNSGTGRPYPFCLDSISVETLNRYADKHLENLGSRATDIARVTDKMPQNFVLLGLIDLLFPGARVIHCMRHPLDTCLSIYFQPFIQHHNYADNLTNLGLYYREYLRLMAHWRTVLRIPLLDLRYEDLVEDPEEKIRLLLDFCELPWDERCLRYHESGRFANTLSYNQVRQPIYKKSVARWRRYEKHLGPLIEALGDACDPLRGAA